MDVSVLVPVRNGGDLLRRQLNALVCQAFTGEYEVIVINNGSTDTSLEIAQQFSSAHSVVRVVDDPHASSRADALNTGAAVAVADKLVTTDHDDWVHHGWLQAMTSMLDDYPLVSGSTRLLHEPLTQDQFDGGFSQAVGVHGRFLPFALGCNLGVTMPVFRSLGGFDPSMDKAEDVDFCWRAQLSGVEMGFAPDAKLLKSVRASVGQRYRQHVGYGVADVALARRFSVDGYGGVRVKALKQVVWLAVSTPRLAWQGRLSDAAAVAGSAAGVLWASVPWATRGRSITRGQRA